MRKMSQSKMEIGTNHNCASSTFPEKKKVQTMNPRYAMSTTAIASRRPSDVAAGGVPTYVLVVEPRFRWSQSFFAP